jgi:hypothetical protein
MWNHSVVWNWVVKMPRRYLELVDEKLIGLLLILWVYEPYIYHLEHSQLRNHFPDRLDLQSLLVCGYSAEREISLPMAQPV